MPLCRRPKAHLSSFVSLVWTADGTPPPSSSAQRELVLPTGAMHCVLRLGDSPLRVYSSAQGPIGRVFSTSVMGGIRSAAYCKDTSTPAATIGVVLRPGIPDLVSRTPAGALANRHTCLEDIWHRLELAELRERLESGSTPAGRLHVLEEILTRHLPTVRGVEPLIAHALSRFDHGAAVSDVVVESGFSHRHLTRTFTDAVGLSPKSYCRLRRFNRTLNRLHAAPGAALADISAGAGYADQAHMTREFRTIAGVTPGHYRRVSPTCARHVPLAPGCKEAAVRFVQDDAHTRPRD